MTLRRGRLKKRMGRLSGRPGGNLPQPLPSPRPSPGRLSGKEPSRTAPGVGPAIPSDSGGREPRPLERPDVRPPSHCFSLPAQEEIERAHGEAGSLVLHAHLDGRLWPDRERVEHEKWAAYVYLYSPTPLNPHNTAPGQGWDAYCTLRRERFYKLIDDEIVRLVRNFILGNRFIQG